MLVRYSASEQGKVKKRAEIYTPPEHGISLDDIDPDALRITRRLRNAGHSAYIVGGAVRDLLTGRKPKDFDIATDAYPRKIRKLFRNSRIIGRRFRLVHVYFGDKIIEVSTFRAMNPDEFNSLYGTIQEDVLRRDFSCNALYFSPEDGVVIDYVGGMRDIKKKKIRPLIPLHSIFTEDPVRMVRAAKYSAITGFNLSFTVARKIKKHSPSLQECPPSRMTEEVLKILKSKTAFHIFKLCEELKLLRYMLPRLKEMIDNPPEPGFRDKFLSTLKRFDDFDGEPDKSMLLVPLLSDYLDRCVRNAAPGKLYHKDAFVLAKEFIKPICPPNAHVDAAIRIILNRYYKRRKRRKRRKKPD